MKLKWSFILLLFLYATGSGAVSFDPIPAGVRGRSMGGAYISVADDPTAIYWNPAGICQATQTQILLETYYEWYQIDENIKEFDSEYWDNSHYANPFHFFGAVIPFNQPKLFNGRIALGLSYHRMNDFYSNYERDEFIEEEIGRMNAFSLAIGCRLTDQLFLGVAVNRLTGDRKYSFTDNSDELYGGYHAADSSYSGISTNWGFKAKIKSVNAGLSFKQPFTLTERTAFGTSDAKIRMPCIWGVGLSVPFSGVLLSFDFERRDFANFYRTYDNLYDENAARVRKRIGFRAINQWRIGAEYSLKYKAVSIPVRMGVATTPTMWVDMNDHPTKGSLLTFGLGVIHSIFSFNIGCELNQFLFKTQTDQAYTENYYRLLMNTTFSFDLLESHQSAHF
jgi:hypothetical protein